MYNIIALMGEAGSGKDRTMQAVLAENPTFHEIISCTTRPMREGEAHGINYFYYTAQQFSEKVLDDEMLEYTVFNDWFYGTSFDSVRSDGVINIGVFNPAGIESLLARPDCNVIVFWIKANDKMRLLRQLKREENPNVSEIIRRFQADSEDFNNINDLPFTILENNNVFDLSKNIKEIAHLSQLYFATGQR